MIFLRKLPIIILPRFREMINPKLFQRYLQRKNKWKIWRKRSGFISLRWGSGRIDCYSKKVLKDLYHLWKLRSIIQKKVMPRMFQIKHSCIRGSNSSQSNKTMILKICTVLILNYFISRNGIKLKPQKKLLQNELKKFSIFKGNFLRRNFSFE